MWRKLLKGILYGSLILGTLGGLGMMMESEDSAGVGFVTIVVVWLSASIFGLVLEMATDISKIADNSKEINEILKNTFLTPVDKMDNTQVLKGNLEEKKLPAQEPREEKPTVKEQTVKHTDTWTCKCGKENPLKNNFCTECGEKRP